MAEISYQHFGKKRTYRMIVRRVAPTSGTQLWLTGVAYSTHYAFVTDREGDILELEADHRQHVPPRRVMRICGLTTSLSLWYEPEKYDFR